MKLNGLRVFRSIALFAFACLSTALAGQTAPMASPSTSQSAPNSSASSSAPAQAEFTLSPEKYRQAVEYSRAKYTHYFVNQFYAIVVLLLVLAWKLGPRFRNWAERASRRRFVQVLIYAPLLLLAVDLLTAPSDIWDQWLERKFGLSVQGWGSWTGDWFKNQIITLIVGTILVWILYAVIRRSPRRWWFYFWLASLPVLTFVVFVAPVVIEPMFFKFEPLQPKNPELVAAIEKVVQRGGMNIPPDRMFEMNASSKLTGLDASVQGFGGSKRVVVWDTTLAKATIPETLFVFGHEMGHYVLLHIPKELAIDALILLVLCYLGFRLANAILGRWGSAWGIRELGDLASLPVLLLLLSVLTFLASPAFNTVSRYFEHEADRYGLEVIHGLVPDANQVAAQYFQMSSALNLADPNPSPFIVFWFFDHPSRPQRIRFVSTYDPWVAGRSPRYVK